MHLVILMRSTGMDAESDAGGDNVYLEQATYLYINSNK